MLAAGINNKPDLIYLSDTPFQAGQLIVQIRSTPGLETVPNLGNEILFSPELFR
jgi:hypothetical protein